MKHPFLNKMQALALLSLLFPLTFAATLTGCGGGSGADQPAQSSTSSPGASGTGRATFTIKWPELTPASRLIPKATKSIVVEAYYDPRNYYEQLGPAYLVDKKTVTREEGKDTATVTLENLPIDQVLVRARAYATTDGTGTPLAQGNQFLTVTEGTPATIKLIMNSTIKALKITPVNPTVEGLRSVQALRYQQMFVTAYDSVYVEYANVVLTSPDKIEWSSSDPTIAHIDAKGLVTGLKPGRVTLTVRDTESGVSVSKLLDVNEERNRPAQFSPLSHEFAPTLVPGDFNASGDTYVIDSDQATITDTTTGQQVAQGQLVTRTKDTKTATYAVFTFAGDIRIRNGSRVTGRGANPVVLLARNSFLLDSNAKIDFSAQGDIPGPGGYGVAQGPGRGGALENYQDRKWRGGGASAGRGGFPALAPYFDSEFLQGASGGNVTGAGGGSLYIASVGSFTIRDATIAANGGGILSDPANRTGGAGGAIFLWSGQAVTLTRATLEAKGGASIGTYEDIIHSSGAGGMIYYGVPYNTKAPAGPFTLNVDGGPVLNNTGDAGTKGVASSQFFEGF